VTSGFGQLLRLVCFCPATTTVSAKSSPTRDTSMQHARDREGNDNWTSSSAGRRQEKDTDGMNIAEKREGLAEVGASTKQPVDRACLPCRLSHLACDSYPLLRICWLINSAPMFASTLILWPLSHPLISPLFLCLAPGAGHVSGERARGRRRSAWTLSGAGVAVPARTEPTRRAR
jgi:hypothetical protein